MRSEGVEMVEMHGDSWWELLNFTERDRYPLEGFEKRSNVIWFLLSGMLWAKDCRGSKFPPGRPLRMLLHKSRWDDRGWNQVLPKEGWETVTSQVCLEAELRGSHEQQHVGWKGKSRMTPRFGAWATNCNEFCRRGMEDDEREESPEKWGRSSSEPTRGVSINSRYIQTVLWWKTSFPKVHSIGCNFRTFLRHVQQIV